MAASHYANIGARTKVYELKTKIKEIFKLAETNGEYKTISSTQSVPVEKLKDFSKAYTKDIGAMLCAWEQTYEQEIHFSIENLSAMSEKVWNVKRVCDDKEFLAKQAPLIYLAALIIRDR